MDKEKQFLKVSSAKWYFRSQGLDHWVCSLMLVDRANEHRHVLCVCVCVNTQTHTYTHSNFYLNIYFCICFYIEKHQFTLKPILVFCPICNSFLWYWETSLPLFEMHLLIWPIPLSITYSYHFLNFTHTHHPPHPIWALKPCTRPPTTQYGIPS